MSLALELRLGGVLPLAPAREGARWCPGKARAGDGFSGREEPSRAPHGRSRVPKWRFSTDCFSRVALDPIWAIFGNNTSRPKPASGGLFLFLPSTLNFALSSSPSQPLCSPSPRLRCHASATGKARRAPLTAPPERPLGVIEALTSVQTQCPHAAVREHAARALEAIKAGGPDVLRRQASLVLSTLAGWRGARADAVKRSLIQFLDETAVGPESPRR